MKAIYIEAIHFQIETYSNEDLLKLIVCNAQLLEISVIINLQIFEEIAQINRRTFQVHTFLYINSKEIYLDTTAQV